MQNKAIESSSHNNNKDVREEDLYRTHKELCGELNMDEGAKERSWQSYRSISYNYTLNGNQTHWLCCSIFVACRQSLTKTVGDQSSVLEGNCVSLTRLLRICGISIHDFFQKIHQWMEMASTPKSFRNKIEKLEHGFAVSVILYRKFSPIFEDLFNTKTGSVEKGKSNKKSKPLPCSPTKLYEFAWCLFVAAKGEYPDHSVDLVTSFHMLLCCCDLIYANVINEKRTDLINPKFKGVPLNWGKEDFTNTAPLCIIEELCQLYEGAVVDALHTKMYVWKSVIQKMFETNILKGNSQTFMDLVTPTNFEYNLKSLNNSYETYVLSCGEVDERIFIKHIQIGSRNFGANGTAASIEDGAIQSLVPQTPLTGRSGNYLRARDPVQPLAIAHDNVSKLRAVFSISQNELPQGMIELMKKTNSMTLLTESLENRLKEMSGIFNENIPSTDRWSLVKGLYYHLLLNILESELKIRPSLDIRVLLKEDLLHRTLIVCCVEIVVYSFYPQRRFPAVLQWYNMHPFNFYRIIEMVVLNHQDGLTRDIIKHLNVIEEQTLESFAWETNSPLWERIKAIGFPLPLCQDVDRPKIIGCAELAGITPHNPSFRKSEDVDKKTDIEFLTSPSGVKKQLFQDDCPLKGPSNSGELSKSIVINNQENNIRQSAGQEEAKDQNYHLLASTKKSTNRAGSLTLFFRKFYKLASIRMVALCKGLELNDQDLLKKIWTVFEHSIVEQTDLMRDRHLDQMIMCAIYVIFRVTKLSRNFKDIMTHYRNQPQWASHIYRSVLIEQRNDSGEQKEQSNESPERQKNRYEPGDLAGTAQNYGNEVRGDIIMFYNTVYVKKMQGFAMKFADTASKDSLLLSPLPHNANQIMSPKKVSEHHHIFIQSLGRNLLKSPSLKTSLSYNFPRSPIKDSPSKDLMEINRVVNQTRSVKRQITTEESGADDRTFDKRPKIPRKLESLISDRQGQRS
uniref:CSON004352 protein n=1 Tax=Culicoides sonorensis TaxID=179676 RepID=A0A336M5G2_CULSO